jgi:hypothetical protein
LIYTAFFPSPTTAGFVLLWHHPDGKSYDVHIAFRGSRSGSAGRAAWQSFSDGNARGNPDWITDLGYNQLSPDDGADSITAIGTVNRGFAVSMQSIFPALFGCLEKVVDLAPQGQPPRRIYVTGHSLGGALAQHFASSVLLGNRYATASGGEMPARLRSWPWQQLKLITYGAPRSGNSEWARTLTVDQLESELFTTRLNPYDSDALTSADSSIIPRLTNTTRPAAYRVLISNDPITTGKFVGGKHVGKTVYVNDHSMLKLWAMPDTEAHEPSHIRQYMVDGLNDPRIPTTAWKYLPMTALNPMRNPKLAGSKDEFRKLIEAVAEYHRSNSRWFDEAAFNRQAALFLSFLNAE